jgi:hypothetical protein
LPAPQWHNHPNAVIATEARKTAAVAGLRTAKDVGGLAVRVVFVVDPMVRVVFAVDQVVAPADRVVVLRPK